MTCHRSETLDASQQQAWDAFVLQHVQKDSGFLQSYAWSQCQKAFGHTPVFFQWKEKEVLMQLVAFIQPWYVGKFLYIPRGPLGRKEILADALKDVEAFAKENKFVCVEIDAPVGLEIPWKKTGHTRQPAETLLLDLTLSEEDLLKQMKQKTRYNIRLAEKQGIRVERRQDEKALDIFLSLLEKTAKRQGFGLHTQTYYRQIFDSDLDTSIYIAWNKEVPVAAHFLIWFGSTVVYLHGGSDDQYKAMMAPNLLHWQEIKDAKAAGKQIYDFWGIDTTGKNKTWAGFTRFKQGFAPEVKPTMYGGNFIFIQRIFLYHIVGIARFFLSF